MDYVHWFDNSYKHSYDFFGCIDEENRKYVRSGIGITMYNNEEYNLFAGIYKHNEIEVGYRQFDNSGWFGYRDFWTAGFQWLDGKYFYMGEGINYQWIEKGLGIKFFQDRTWSIRWCSDNNKLKISFYYDGANVYVSNYDNNGNKIKTEKLEYCVIPQNLTVFPELPKINFYKNREDSYIKYEDELSGGSVHQVTNGYLPNGVGAKDYHRNSTILGESFAGMFRDGKPLAGMFRDYGHNNDIKIYSGCDGNDLEFKPTNWSVRIDYDAVSVSKISNGQKQFLCQYKMDLHNHNVSEIVIGNLVNGIFDEAIAVVATPLGNNNYKITFQKRNYQSSEHWISFTNKEYNV